MIVPRFWAEAILTDKVNRKSVTIRRFGWSDSSQDDAQSSARDRAGEAMSRFLSGEKVDRREPRVAYNGAEGVPIREEIVSTMGDTIITRNLYGARCLNTPDVLFADVDYQDNPSIKLWIATTLVLFAGTFGLLRYLNFSLASSIPLGLVLAMLFGNALVYRLDSLLWRLRGGREKHALGRIRAFLGRHPDWHVRVYRTPAGMRLLVLHKLFDPADVEVAGFFESLGTDPLYQRMCLNQRCFRARVSAKPWRIGIASHMKPRPGVWPIHLDRMPQRQLWVDQYEQVASQYAACDFLDEIGGGTEHPKAREVRSLHDQLCRVGCSLPIA